MGKLNSLKYSKFTDKAYLFNIARCLCVCIISEIFLFMKQYFFILTNLGHNDIDYANGNADKSHTWDDSTQIQFVTDMIYWMAFRRQAIRAKAER